MRYLDIDSWSRKVHYNYFRELDYPHFNICGNVDITEFNRYIKEKRAPFFLSFLYVSARIANNIEELRCRIRGDKVVVHDQVHPSFTVMTEKGVFGFCTANYKENYESFCLSSAEVVEKAKANLSVEDEPGRDDLLYITSIPWISFTSITNPVHMRPVDSIPRISWGKYFETGERVLLPLSVQVHHALADGAHVGRFFMELQELLDAPEEYF